MDGGAVGGAQDGTELRAGQSHLLFAESLDEADAFPAASQAHRIDNNIVERALKKAILNRRNALFYKTLNGAGVGDLFMSLIHTCELNGANPFDYLTELQRHAEELNCAPVGVDAVELPRDTGAAGTACRGVI